MVYYASHMVETRPDLFRGHPNGTNFQGPDLSHFFFSFLLFPASAVMGDRVVFST